MKKILFSLSVLVLLAACGGSDKKTTTTIGGGDGNPGLTINDDGDKTGTFSFDGTSVTGRVTTQYFGDKTADNFSVLCQHDESISSPNFELLQITFVNETDGTTNPDLKVYHGSMLPTKPDAGAVTVNLSGHGNGLDDKHFFGSDKTTGSLKVSNRTIEARDLVLYTREGEKRTINATIPF